MPKIKINMIEKNSRTFEERRNLHERLLIFLLNRCTESREGFDECVAMEVGSLMHCRHMTTDVLIERLGDIMIESEIDRGEL